MKSCDLIVIGGGPAGYNSAEYAAKNGLSVTLFEKKRVGGTCLNVGCIPTKSLLYAAKIYHYTSEAGREYGVTTTDARMDHAKAVAKKDSVVDTLVGGVEAGLRKHKVNVISGKASIKRDVGGFVVAVDGTAFAAKNVIVASGSAPVMPPIEGAQEGYDKGYVLTSDEILSITEVPRRLVIVGGGVIGMEMAAYFMEAGAHVTVIEMMDKILGLNDREISSILQKEMEKKGMEIILSAAVRSISRDKVFYSRGGQDGEVAFDKVLMCVGRRPNTDIDGLRETGVSMERGAIVVDEHMRTSLTGMYAVGDVNAKLMLAHVGYRQGEVAVNDILGQKDSMSYAAICGVVYTQPEAAFVGYSEEAARAAGLDIDVRKTSINFSGRHIAENGMSSGLCKLLIDRKRDIIIGAAVLSSYASEYTYALALMIENKIPVASIKKTVFPHPTVCEIIREALL